MQLGSTQLILLQIAREKGLTLSDIAHAYAKPLNQKNRKTLFLKARKLEILGLLKRNNHSWTATEKANRILEKNVDA